MNVYRVQDVEGRGPWRPGFSEQWAEDRTAAEYATMKPLLADFPDIQSRFRKGLHYGCACTSIAMLRRWIRIGEWRTLQDFGFICMRFDDVKVIAKSERQIVIERKKPFRNGGNPIMLYPNRVKP